jgi:hypothetical protein
MAIDPQALLQRPFGAIEHRYTARDTMLYALGLGLGADPMDRGQLRYVYEDGLAALPTFANVLAYPGFWAREPDTGIDWQRLVHAEQAIVLHAPLPVQGVVVGRNRITGIWDKGAGKGALMQQVRELANEAGEPRRRRLRQRGRRCSAAAARHARPHPRPCVRPAHLAAGRIDLSLERRLQPLTRRPCGSGCRRFCAAYPARHVHHGRGGSRGAAHAA